jgi:hypothetical protein
MYEFVLLFLIGLVAYSYGAIAGGQTFLTVPALLFAGLSPVAALATNLASQILPSFVSVGNYWRHGKIRTREVLPLAVFFVVGALIGAHIVLSLDESVLNALIAFLLVTGVILLLAKNRISFSFLKGNKALEALLLFAVGVYRSVFGASATTFTMMILSMGRGMEMVEASAASSVLLSFAIVAGSAYFIWSGAVSWPHMLALTLGSSIGAFIGTQIAVKKGNAFVEKILVLVALVGAVKVLFF